MSLMGDMGDVLLFREGRGRRGKRLELRRSSVKKMDDRQLYQSIVDIVKRT